MTAQLINLEKRLELYQSQRILLVEDNDINRMLLSDYLSLFKYHVEGLASGHNFFTKIKTFQPNLILLDLKLPDIDGYSLLEEIQLHSIYSKIPILIVSAFAFTADKERAMKLGARRYFVKPVNLSELVLAINEELAFCSI
jgi:two-component system, cell cycle response regulator DivK